MQTHVKILAVIHIVFGTLGIIGALVVFALFGGIAGLIGGSGEQGAAIAVPLVGGLGGIIAVVVLVLSVPGLIIGIGLLEMRPWARIGGIVLSALNLLHVPIGTALGVYGLWVLLNSETEQLFQQQQFART